MQKAEIKTINCHWHFNGKKINECNLAEKKFFSDYIIFNKEILIPELI